MKIVKLFQPKIVIFKAVKNRCMLHVRVFVMDAKAVARAFVVCISFKQYFFTMKLKQIIPYSHVWVAKR